MSRTNKKTDFVCTKGNPWTPEKGDRAVHPDAIYLKDVDLDYSFYEVYDCPNCGLRLTLNYLIKVKDREFL